MARSHFAGDVSEEGGIQKRSFQRSEQSSIGHNLYYADSEEYYMLVYSTFR